jgi:hypothetical protein
LTILEAQVRNSKDHTPDEINAMADAIELAALINGDDDIIRRSLKMILINGVRRELKDPARIQAIAECTAKTTTKLAVAKHIDECRNRENGNIISLEKGKLRVTGKAALVFSVIFSISVAMGVFTYWQNSKMQKILSAYQNSLTVK